MLTGLTTSEEDVALAEKVTKMDKGALMKYFTDCDIKEISCWGEKSPARMGVSVALYAKFSDEDKRTFRAKIAPIEFHTNLQLMHRALAEKDVQAIVKKHTPTTGNGKGLGRD